MVAPSRRFIVLSGYDRRRQAALQRASERLDNAAGELERIRDTTAQARRAYNEAMDVYLAEYAKFLRLVTKAKHADVPAARVARWSGMTRVTIWKLMRNPRTPKRHPSPPQLLRRTSPPRD